HQRWRVLGQFLPNTELPLSMLTAVELKTRIASAYNAALDRYGQSALSHRDRFGQRVVELTTLRPGEYVLDVCCGVGSSALPAARAVAPNGRVIGVDVAATRSLARGNERQQRGLPTPSFRSPISTRCISARRVSTLSSACSAFFS